MEVVCDASPIICLSKIGRLDLLHKLFEKIIIPYEVREEVITRGKEDFPTETLLIEKACAEGWLVCKPLQSTLQFEALDAGESEVISLAQKLKIKTVLIDDALGRKFAESFSLRVRGTLFVLIESYRKKTITKEEVESLLNKLVQNGFRISTEVYAECLHKISTLD